MKRSKITLFILLICVFTSLFVGCTEQESEIPKKRYEEFEPIVEEWVNDYLDEISDDLGELIAFNIPLVKDIAGQLIKDKFIGQPKSTIISAEENVKTSEIVVTVKISRMLTIDVDKEIDILSRNVTMNISKKLHGSVNYRLNIKNGEVKDYDIDLESFSSHVSG